MRNFFPEKGLHIPQYMCYNHSAMFLWGFCVTNHLFSGCSHWADFFMPYKRHRCIIHYSTHAVNARFSRIRILNLTKSESFDCEISIFRWLERFQCNSHFFMYVRICKQGDFSNHQKQEKPFCNERLLLCGCLYSRKSPSKAFQLSSSIPAVSAVQAVRRFFLLRCGRVGAPSLHMLRITSV